MPPSKSKGFLSSFSPRFLPSFVQSRRAGEASVMVGVATSTTTSAAMRPTEARAGRTTFSATTALHGAGVLPLTSQVTLPTRAASEPLPTIFADDHQ